MTEEEIQRIEERLMVSLQQTMKEAVKESVKENIAIQVNGKIDKIDARQREYMALNAEHNRNHDEQMEKIHAHMEEVQPYLSGAKGFKVFIEFGKWVVGMGVIWAYFKGFISPFK